RPEVPRRLWRDRQLQADGPNRWELSQLQASRGIRTVNSLRIDVGSLCPQKEVPAHERQPNSLKWNRSIVRWKVYADLHLAKPPVARAVHPRILNRRQRVEVVLRRDVRSVRRSGRCIDANDQETSVRPERRRGQGSGVASSLVRRTEQLAADVNVRRGRGADPAIAECVVQSDGEPRLRDSKLDRSHRRIGNGQTVL